MSAGDAPLTPLRGKRVLITRPAQQSAAFAARLRAAGAEPIAAPTIAIGPPTDPQPARDAVARVRAYAWVAFTSGSGVDAFFTLFGEDAGNARALEGVQIAAIGPKTAEALAARGVRAGLVPPAYVNEALAAALIARTAPGDRVLIFRAEDARAVLPERLREAGRTVDDVAAYATRLVDDAGLRAKAERADIVTFTSASTVRGFVHNVADAGMLLAGKTVAAIGPITAEAARGAGIRVDAVAATFTVEGLVDALNARASGTPATA